MKKKSRSLGAKMDVDVVGLNYLTGCPGDRNIFPPTRKKMYCQVSRALTQ